MQEEIKEILEKLKDNIPIEEYRSEGTSDGLTHYEEDKDSWQYKLLDYITNLQEELEEEKRIEKESLKTIQNLEEDNKQLKELCDKYEEEHSTTFQIWKYNKDTYKEENERLTQGVTLLTNELIDMTKAKEDYKSRNEKAIEYINKYKNQNWYIESRFTEELLNVLQGVDKE